VVDTFVGDTLVSAVKPGDIVAFDNVGAQTPAA